MAALQPRIESHRTGEMSEKYPYNALQPVNFSSLPCRQLLAHLLEKLQKSWRLHLGQSFYSLPGFWCYMNLKIGPNEYLMKQWICSTAFQKLVLAFWGSCKPNGRAKGHLITEEDSSLFARPSRLFADCLNPWNGKLCLEWYQPWPHTIIRCDWLAGCNGALASPPVSLTPFLASSPPAANGPAFTPLSSPSPLSSSSPTPSSRSYPEGKHYYLLFLNHL